VYDGRVHADGRTVMQRYWADHDCACPHSDAVTYGRPASAIVSDADLLVDPTVASDGFRADDRANTVLDEKARADPIGLEGQRGARPV